MVQPADTIAPDHEARILIANRIRELEPLLAQITPAAIQETWPGRAAAIHAQGVIVMNSLVSAVGALDTIGWLAS